jgi:putative membrane protein
MKGKKLVALIAIAALSFLPLNANAAPKVSDYENVYVIQDSSGEVKKVISVDWLRIQGEGSFSVVDPIEGAQSPEILIGDATISQGSNGITVTGKSNGISDIFYRTNLSKNLPFQLKMNVLINGQPSSVKDLDEATGTVDVGIEFTNYYKQNGTYMPWLVNMSLTLDGPSVKDITVSTGNVSYVGSKAMATLMMQVLSDKATATISYVALKKNSPTMSISIMPTLMAVELPNMSNLKDMAKAIDGIATGIDGYSQALTKMANSIQTNVDLSSLQNASLLLDAYNQILSQMYQQLNPEQLSMLPKVVDGLKALEQPLTQTASALNGLSTLVSAYMGLASQSLAINEQVTNALAMQPQLQGKEQILQLMGQQQLLLQAMTKGATLPSGYVPSMETLQSSLQQLSQGSMQMVAAIEQTASQMSMLNQLSSGLLVMRSTLGTMLNGGTIQGQKLPAMSEVSTQLKSGVTAMQKQISQGMLDLKTALTTLVKGGTLNGQKIPPMSELSNGLRQISKGANQAYETYSSETQNLDKAKKLADSYKSFDGLPSGADGKVMFIIKIED